MKNQKLLAVAALAGLTLGGLSVTAASAQSYGDDSSASAVETTDDTVATDTGDIATVQDTEDPAPGDGAVDHREQAAVAVAATSRRPRLRSASTKQTCKRPSKAATRSPTSPRQTGSASMS